MRLKKHTRYNLAWGHGGQQIALVDELDLVVVATADPLYAQIGDEPWRLEKANFNLVADFIASLPGSDVQRIAVMSKLAARKEMSSGGTRQIWRFYQTLPRGGRLVPTGRAAMSKAGVRVIPASDMAESKRISRRITKVIAETNHEEEEGGVPTLR